MSYQGRIEKGVVVFDEPVALAEGTVVRVEPVSSNGSGAAGSAGDWAAAARAAQVLRDTGYDFDAVRRQREFDLKHADDHQP